MDFLVKPVVNKAAASDCPVKYCCYSSGKLQGN